MNHKQLYCNGHYDYSVSNSKIQQSFFGNLQYGLSDVLQLNLSSLLRPSEREGNTYLSINSAIGLRKQLSPNSRFITDIIHYYHTIGNHSLSMDVTYDYLSTNSISIDRMLSDEDGYFYHMLGKEQIKLSSNFTTPSIKINNGVFSVPLSFSLRQLIGYGISDFLNLVGNASISWSSSFNSIRFGFWPELKFTNYKYTKLREISRVDYYLGDFLEPLNYRGYVYLYSSFDYPEFDSWYIKPGIFFTVGITDNLEGFIEGEYGRVNYIIGKPFIYNFELGCRIKIIERLSLRLEYTFDEASSGINASLKALLF